MSDSLNVIALISGGKDSFFSLLHCIQNGHRVIALANLCPVDDGSPNEGTDLNSFMYQTVGHSLIPLYAAALQLPLYRRQITGTSVQQSQYYDSSSSTQIGVDETEDLVPLLRQVISVHPEANAISTGAILSTYQRTRVESIAVRLGLTPLSYLWQYPVLPPPMHTSSSPKTDKHRSDSLTGLLEDAASAGLDARIIKIASAGIPENLLFANVTDTRTQSRLVKGLAPFFESHDELGLRGAVLGEGGEYETITVSGPRDVWRGGRIELDESAKGAYAEGGVTYATFGKARVIPYDDEAAGVVDIDNTQCLRHQILTPALFDPQFVELVRKLELSSLETVRGGVQKDTLQASSTLDSRPQPNYSINLESSAENGQVARQQTSRLSSAAAAHTSNISPAQINLSHTISANSISINNLTSTSIQEYLSSHLHSVTSTVSNNRATMPRATSADQLQTILNHLPAMFAQLSQKLGLPLSTANIVSASLLLSSISDFASVNPIYSQMYPSGLPNPPARVTIAAPLPPGIDVSLSVTLDLSMHDQRLGLHVQGRSYWAPANIGPYSQAISTLLRGRNSMRNVSLQAEEVNEASDQTTSSKLRTVYVAGQIPLVPSSMQVYAGPYLETAVLGLQHLWRVGQEREVDIWPWGVAYLAANHEVEAITRVNISAAVWRQAHIESTSSSDVASDSENDGTSQQSDSDETSNFDIWDIQNNRSLHHGFRESQIGVGKHLHVLPNHSVFDIKGSLRLKHIPTYLVVEVTALPRNVSVEWWSNGIGGLTRTSTLTLNRPRLEWQTRSFEWGSLSCLTITLDPTRPTETVKFITYLFSCTSQSTLLTNNDNIPTTLSTIIHLLNDSNDNSLPFSTTHLVQDTAFVTTTVLTSSIWSHFTPTSSDLSNELNSSSPSQQHNRPQIPPEDLISNATIIPCHRLWGCAASTVPIQSRHRGLSESQPHKFQDPMPLAGELSIAFLLRAETS